MRRLIFLIPLVAAALAAVLVVLNKPSIVPSGNDRRNAVSNTSTPATNANDNSGTIPGGPSGRDEVLKVSRLFSERFASTSTERPTAHLESARQFASSSLQAAFDRIAAQPSPQPGESVIVTSRAYGFFVRSLSDQSERAEVTVSLRRTERVDLTTPVSYTQDINLQLIREDGVWKVNLALWGQRQG
ncbi:MAG: hypothetical protein HY420_03925 [Candidatus Kerfeldbacteria bacterium]|nr:hypothetical protein [Candidatus Kerfeldbacteria bacterium]